LVEPVSSGDSYYFRIEEYWLKCDDEPGLHRGVAHYLFYTCLVNREPKQILFSRYMSGRHSSKLFLHSLNDNART
jgi:hypothetical protein